MKLKGLRETKKATDNDTCDIPNPRFSPRLVTSLLSGTIRNAEC